MKYIFFFLVLTMALPANGEDIWSRKNFSVSQEKPFVFYIIYGVKNVELTLSKKKHNVTGMPEGLGIMFYSTDVPEQADSVHMFLDGPMGKVLKSNNPKEYKMALGSKSIAIVKGEVEDSDSLEYLRNTLGIVKALSEKGANAILDVQTISLYSVETWQTTFFAPKSPNPREHVVILYSDEVDGRWYHTRGMRKFGRPDISLKGWPKDKYPDGVDLINRFIEMFAFGEIAKKAAPLKINSLPTGLKYTLLGGYDNFDFNNYYIEIVYPK